MAKRYVVAVGQGQRVTKLDASYWLGCYHQHRQMADGQSSFILNLVASAVKKGALLEGRGVTELTRLIKEV